MAENGSPGPKYVISADSVGKSLRQAICAHTEMLKIADLYDVCGNFRIMHKLRLRVKIPHLSVTELISILPAARLRPIFWTGECGIFCQ